MREDDLIKRLAPVAATPSGILNAMGPASVRQFAFTQEEYERRLQIAAAHDEPAHG